MRYLYGDLTEFPPGENVLELLKKMITAAVEVLEIDQRMRKTSSDMEHQREQLASSLLGIDDFHQELQTFIAQRLSASPDRAVVQVAQAAAEKIQELVNQGKAFFSRHTEESIQARQQELEQLGQVLLERLGDFYSPHPLPLRSNRLHCRFDGARYLARYELTDITGATCVYQIDASSTELFSSPRRGQDLFGKGFELAVGYKKAWLKKEPVPEYQRLDEHLLTEVYEEDGALRLCLKKPSTEEGLWIFCPAGGEPSVFIQTAEAKPRPVEAELLTLDKKEKLEALLDQTRRAAVTIYRTPSRLSSISIDNQDLISSRSVTELVKRLVAFLAPTIREIDLRSPSRQELCLKIEHEQGRREEIYVPKSQLAEQIERLPPAQQAIFTPLGISLSAAAEHQLDDGPTQPQ
jgi:hypothetical protein